MPLHTWILLYLASVAVAAVSLALTYYGPLQTGFWKQRYRRVAPATPDGTGEPVDHVGPFLELGMSVLLATGVLFIVLVVFPDTTGEMVSSPGFGTGVLVAVAVLVLLVGGVCFYASPREHNRMIRREPGAFSGLPAETVGRIVGFLDRLTPGHGVEAECRRNRLTYVPYFFYSLNNGVLLVAFVVFSSAGLAAGWSQWHQSEAALETARGALAVGGVGEAFFRQSEILLDRYATFQDALLDFARSLLAVVAVFLLLLFWLLGTSYQLVYTRAVVRIGRVLARGALLVLALLVGYGYADLAYEADRLNTLFGDAVRGVDPAALSTATLERLNGLRFTLSNEATVDDFWARLVNSYGGLMLVVGAFLAFLRQRSTGTSFLGSLLPRPHRHPFLAAVLSVRDEDGWSAAPVGDGGDGDGRDGG